MQNAQCKTGWILGTGVNGGPKRTIVLTYVPHCDDVLC